MFERLSPKVIVRSRLNEEKSVVWNFVFTFEGVNEEMSPFFRMTPPGDVDLDSVSAGQVLSLNINGPLRLPLGIYPLRLVNVEPGTGFLEQTQMLPFFLWQHQRTLVPIEDGTEITDLLSWRWRFHRLDRVVATGVTRFFEHRHHTLSREFR